LIRLTLNLSKLLPMALLGLWGDFEQART